jgi:hypothetical protein
MIVYAVSSSPHVLPAVNGQICEHFLTETINSDSFHHKVHRRPNYKSAMHVRNSIFSFDQRGNLVLKIMTMARKRRKLVFPGGRHRQQTIELEWRDDPYATVLIPILP